MNKQHLEKKRKALLEKRRELIGRFQTAALAGKATRRIGEEIRRTNEALATLDQIEAENTVSANSAIRRYAVSSLFLYESFRKLTADKSEQFFFITGAEVEGVHVLDQWGEFAHERRTPLGVVADVPSTHNLLIKLEQFGHKFLAHFHSHPGKGPDSTMPSGIDERFQTRLEAAGHLALMAIFSRDGYIRFLRLDHNFDLTIYGKGVEQYAPSLYRLTNLDQA